MKKSVSLTAIAYVLATIFLLIIPINVQASPIIENEKFIKEGYTADGIKYSIYELIIPDNETVSRIAVSKWVSIVVYYDGDVIPSSTYPY